jgi:hypothetical protein
VVTGTGVQGQWSSLNLTSWVQNWVKDVGRWPNYGIRLDENGNGASYYKWVATANNASPSLIPYLYVTYKPLRPVLTATNPESPADNTSPLIRGTAESGMTVRLFTTSDCSGSPAATGSSSSFVSPGLSVTVPSNSRTIFRATSTDPGGRVSSCSTSSIVYEDGSADGVDPQLERTSGQRDGVLQWAPPPLGGYGRLLDLCDDNDAAEVLDEGDLATERDRLDITCSDLTNSRFRYAVVHASGAVRLYSQAQVDTAGATEVVARGSQPALRDLGSLREGPVPSTGAATTVHVLEESMTLSGGVLRGLVYNGSAQFARQVVINMDAPSGRVGSEALPMTIQSQELVPFEIDVDDSLTLTELVPSVDAVLSSTPDFLRALLPTNAPGLWRGPAAEFRGIPALRSLVPTTDPVDYYQSEIKAVAPYPIPNVVTPTIQIGPPQVRAAVMLEGRVIDVVEPTTFASALRSDPASSLGEGDYASFGFFLPTTFDGIVLVAWGSP